MKMNKYQNLPVFHFANLIKKNHSKKRMRCIVFGNFGAMNFGDEAILAGELQELKKISGLNVLVVARNPGEIEKLHKTKAVSLYKFRTIVEEINKADFIIVGGGGVICKADRGVIGFLYQLYMLSIYLLIPRIYKKKIYAIGIGIYQNSNPIILKAATYLLKFAKVVTVRDYHSLEFLKNKKIPAKLYKDNSYLMDLFSRNKILKDEKFKHYSKNKTNIGFSLLKPDNKKNEKHLISEIVSYINHNRKKANFWFYLCDYQGNVFNDKKFAHKIYKIVDKKFGSGVNCYLVSTDYSPKLFFSTFKLMDSFIAMRLHSMLFAYRSDIPFKGISYDEKTSSFLKSIGKEELNINDAKWNLK